MSQSTCNVVPSVRKLPSNKHQASSNDEEPPCPAILCERLGLLSLQPQCGGCGLMMLHSKEVSHPGGDQVKPGGNVQAGKTTRYFV